MSDDWQEVSVEEIAAPIANAMSTGPFGSSIGSRFFTTSGVPLIRGSNLSDQVGVRLSHEDIVYVAEETADRFRRSIATDGDLVFTCWGTIGQVGVIDRRSPYRRYLISNKQMKLTPDPRRADSLFLYYLFSGPQLSMRIKSQAIGSSVPGFNLGQLRALKLRLPSVKEQRSVSEVLGSLDDKIEATHRANQTLEAMARALFRSWFVEFDPVRAKAGGRQPEFMDAETAALFPCRLVDSELGKIPEGWGTTLLGNLLRQLETGSRPKGGVAGILEGVPSIGAENVTRIGEYDYSKTKYVPRNFFEAMRKGRLQSWDVLLYKDGGRPGEFEPKVSMVGEGFPFDEMCINEHVYVLRGTTQTTQSVLYLLLSSEMTKEELRRRGTGVAVPGLNSTALRTLPVVLAPASVVQAFDATASSLLRMILRNSSEARTLSQIRDLLLPKLLSGEIRIRDAEAQLAANS